NGFTRSFGLLALIHSSDKIPIHLNSVSNSDFQERALNIYPNPASAFFSFISQKANLLKIEIFDLLGRSVFETTRSNVQEDNLLTIQLPFIPSGSYIIEVSDQKKVYHSQLTIIH